VATITFDRDDKRNAFSAAMSKEVLQWVARAEKSRAAVVILRANTRARVWCSGRDLSELDSHGPYDVENPDPMVAVFRKIQATPLPVISMVEGSVHAGGLLLVMYSDIVIAAQNARVAMTSNKMGLPLEPEMYTYWLRVMGIHKAKELLFTADPISAADACKAGLYNHVVDNRELEGFTAKVAEKILACAPEGVANAKLQLNLLAKRSSLTEADRAAISESVAKIFESSQLKRRITDLLNSIQRT
jgi:methylmalonyl-CoA decarboxylase